MPESVSFILKLLLLSTGISIAIKKSAAFLSVSASTPLVLALVCLPTVILAIVLSWRGYRYSRRT